MKEPIILLKESDLAKREMREVVMQTVEPASKQEATEQMVNILNITYVKADLNQIDDCETHMNAEEITLLISLLDAFEDFFDGI